MCGALSQSGLVVYYVPEQVRGGGGTQQSVVAQGEPVRENQKMIQIPDLDKMLVNVRVPEAFVSHLSKAHEKKQRAKIKVDAFPNYILDGYVKVVDTVASQQDWFASDVKVYKTLVKIDLHNLSEKDREKVQLKPGMSAEVTITADESNEAVLVAPLEAVVGSISMGAERKIFVVGADGQPVMRDIVVGMSNERVVEVKSGLKEGDKVVLNPQALIEGSEMKAGKAKSKGGDDYPGSGGGSGKKKKGPVARRLAKFRLRTVALKGRGRCKAPGC